MIVIIQGKTYDSSDIPILLVLSNQDKYNIEHMDPKASRYLSYPGMKPEEAQKIIEQMIDGEA